MISLQQQIRELSDEELAARMQFATQQAMLLRQLQVERAKRVRARREQRKKLAGR